MRIRWWSEGGGWPWGKHRVDERAGRAGMVRDAVVSTTGQQLSQWRGGYDHARLERKRRILRWMVDHIAFRFLARLESVEGVEYLPEHGPAIVMINPIALTAPVMVRVAPEGTRHPSLQTGKEGIAFLAHRTGAPIVPVAVDGTEGFPTLPFLPRWRGPGVRIRIGRGGAAAAAARQRGAGGSARE